MKKRIIISILCVLVLALTAILFVACDKFELSAPTNVKYDGATITWTAVENADSYIVKINGGDEREVTSPRFPYVANGQAFSVVVTAVSETNKNIKSDETKVEFVALPNIDKITVNDDGTITWDGVQGATAYLVRVDNTEYETNNTSYDAIPEGKHNINVRPIVLGDNSYYSSYLKNNVEINRCGVVAKNDITYVNGNIQWRGVQGAQYYEVWVNGSVYEKESLVTSIAYDADNTNFDVAIRAIGNHSSTFDGQQSETKKFVFLDTVTNISVDNGILSWKPISGADGYKIMLNGSVQNVTLTEARYNNLEANVSYSIQIMPISNDSTYFSDWSAPRNVRVLAAPDLQWIDSLDLDGEALNSVKWNGVQGSQGYSVRLTKPNGEKVEKVYGETERAFADAYIDVGTYKIEAKSLAGANEMGIYDSVYSKAITVIRLAAPKQLPSNFIVSSATGEFDGFTVTFEKVAAATKYRLYKDNVMADNSETNQFRVTNIADSNSLEMQKVNYKVQSIGMTRIENGITTATLNSLSESSLSFDITVLATPTNVNMSGYVYSFNGVEQANGYAVEIGGKTYSSDTNSYNLSMLEAGNYSVKVRAKGNGGAVLASNPSAPIMVTRLAAPTEIRIGTSGQSEGVLSYKGVSYATGYEVVLDNNGQAINSEDIGNMNQRITTKGTMVYMISSANYFNDAHTVYYMTSLPSDTKTFIKLETPTFGDVAFSGNSQFVWNKPSNINERVYTPTYEVADENDIIYNGEKNGTSMDISTLEGDQNYTFTVRAIGNGTNYINSDKSEPVSIYKLATPNVQQKDGKYVWKGVARTNSYVVYVDGVEMDKPIHVGVSDEYEYTPRFTEIKTYKVEVVAVGDGGYTTINSDNATIEQVTKQLVTPEFSVSYDAESFAAGNHIVVTITKPSPYAMKYSYTVSGATNVESSTTYEYVVNNPGEYVVRVYAVGGGFDENGVCYIDSQTAGGNASHTIRILTTPNPIDWTLSRDGVLTWNPTAGAVKYKIEIYVNGEETASIVKEQTSTTLQITDYSNTNSYRVKLTVLGNGGLVVNSQTVERTWNAKA